MTLIWLMIACAPTLTLPRREDDPNDDWDGDGLTENEGDCNDGDATVTNTLYYADADGDGYGAMPPTDSLDSASEIVSITACVQPVHFAGSHDDCDDYNAAVHPHAQEICGNGIDDNCDNDAQCDVPATSATPLVAASAGDLAGAALASWTDLQGVENLLVGAPGAGAVFIVPVSGAGALVNLEAAPSVLQSGGIGDEFGKSVAVFDPGTGVDTFLVGGPGRDGGPGGAWLYSSASLPGVVVAPSASWTGAAYEHAGSQVTSIQSATGRDAVIASMGDDTHAGAVYIVPSAPNHDENLKSAAIFTVLMDAPGEHPAVAGLSDGLGDSLFVGVASLGTVYEYSTNPPFQGQAVPLVDAAESTLPGRASDAFGTTVVAIGDVNGDGYDDIAVGAPDSDDGSMDHGSIGVVAVYAGAFEAPVLPEPLVRITGADAHTHLGASIAPAGRPTDSLYAAFIIGAGATDCDSTPDPAAAWLVEGPYPAAGATISIGDQTAGNLTGFARGTDPCGGLGTAVAGDTQGAGWVAAGDAVDGSDGRGELLLFPGPWSGS